MLDLELLRSFSRGDAAALPAPGERVHRTQSTVSQQIKLYDVGQPLLNRSGQGRDADGSRRALLSYARRLRRSPKRPRRDGASGSDGAVKLGIPRFAAYRLAKLLATFSRSRPGLLRRARRPGARICGAISNGGDLDLALLKPPPEKRRHRGLAQKVTGHQQDPSDRHQIALVPLIGFRPAASIARGRSMRSEKRRTFLAHAYTSSGLAGIQARSPPDSA